MFSHDRARVPHICGERVESVERTFLIETTKLNGTLYNLDIFIVWGVDGTIGRWRLQIIQLFLNLSATEHCHFRQLPIDVNVVLHAFLALGSTHEGRHPPLCWTLDSSAIVLNSRQPGISFLIPERSDLEFATDSSKGLREDTSIERLCCCGAE
jgi:hypothetical protein